MNTGLRNLRQIDGDLFASLVRQPVTNDLDCELSNTESMPRKGAQSVGLGILCWHNFEHNSITFPPKHNEAY